MEKNSKHRKVKNEKVKKPQLRKTKKEKSTKTKKIIAIVVISLVILLLVGLGILAAIFLSDDWGISEENLVISNQNTIVYDKDGNEVAVLTGDETRIIITSDQMAELLPKAFVAIEDERFYKHNGVDLKRTAAATVTFVTHGGKSSFGGSTITQQLVKNMMKDDANTGVAGVVRKVKEMSRAYQIERMISKDQVLELYLNVIFMGQKCYGVEVASQFYFSKSAKDLSLAECAFLAGINHSPNSYNPFSDSDNKDRINNRAKTVIEKMKELGYIDDEQRNQAMTEIDEGLKFQEGKISTGSNISYHTAAAVNEIIYDLMEKNDLSYDMAKLSIYGSGMKIYTTQDTNVQKAMEEEFANEKYLKKSRKTKNPETGEYVHSQAAMVVIDHKTGQVVGTVGGLGTDVNSAGINRATQSKRQIGSTMKPIGVVSPALEAGVVTAGTVYDDSPTSHGTYNPKNAGSYRGLITVRKAIEVSSNVVNVKIMSNLGPDNSIKFLKKLGITSINEDADANLSLALGTPSITPLEVGAAYATIANDGVYISPTFYTKVEDIGGNIILESEQETRRVMTEANAAIMKSILTAPVEGSNGTATGCRMSGFSVAAKTGTTDDNYDRWLCGFTTYYTGACWYGFDQNESISFSGNPAAQIWAGAMKTIHKDLPKTTFEMPSSVVSAKICADSGCLATDSCRNTYTEYFVKGTVPSACEGHKTVKICLDSGCIANEYCTNVEERTFLSVPEKEKNPSWKTSSGDKYNEITQVCTIHKEPVIEKVKITNVIGKTAEAAKAELVSLGFKVNIQYVEDNSVSNGVVLRQSSSEGTELEKGSSITLKVNKITESSKNETSESGNTVN